MIARLALALVFVLVATLSGQVPAARSTDEAPSARPTDESPPARSTDEAPSARPTGESPPTRPTGESPPAQPAEESAFAQPRLKHDAVSDSWMLSGDFEVPLTRSLEEAVRRGVPLYFVLEFELIRPRWWWTDETVVERSIVYRLAYHALTRQYRLNFDGLTQTWDTLSDATRAMSRVRQWRVFDASVVRPGTRYEARVRLRLDASQLPKPFQVNAITDRDWNPQSEWKDFAFRP